MNIDEAINPSSGYMIFVSGGAAPSVVHKTLEEAKTEAERLSRKSEIAGKSIRVMQIVAALHPTHKWNDQMIVNVATTTSGIVNYPTGFRDCRK